MHGKGEFSTGFCDNIFSGGDWPVWEMSSSSEIKEYLKSLKLEGRIIHSFKAIGHVFNFERCWIEDQVYSGLKGIEQSEREKRSKFENIDPQTKLFSYIEIDEPFLIRFSDGDQLEVDTPMEPSFCISMNKIPWDIKSNVPCNIDANVIFSSCVGAEVRSAEFKTYDVVKRTVYRDGRTKEESHEKSAVILWLSTGVGIKIEGNFDFCDVSMVDRNDQIVSIPFRSIKEALLIDPEDED